MKVAHIDDEDWDLLSFFDLFSALRFIKDEQLSNWVISDMLFGEYAPDDYTYTEVAL